MLFSWLTFCLYVQKSTVFEEFYMPGYTQNDTAHMTKHLSGCYALRFSQSFRMFCIPCGLNSEPSGREPTQAW
ncbi:hypothetical protein HanPSC8_Chr12g0544191 [Helianthus annuus]|uniref:Secreted protein n=1 Tax=Helianthus annuus TaxID=4232 RepID=A0A251T731_HELAN|nr:hypothetical protein HanPSC8_Chr12g0544191 [Helianthus annuus]